jgi:hypothetical protein
MNATAKFKYTDENTEKLKELYTAKGNAGIADIATELGTTPRSVISKLVNLKVYVPTEKAPARAKDEGPTKKELFQVLTDLNFDPAGLEGATKDAVQRIIDRLKV